MYTTFILGEIVLWFLKAEFFVEHFRGEYLILNHRKKFPQRFGHYKVPRRLALIKKRFPSEIDRKVVQSSIWVVVEPPTWKICSSNWIISPSRGENKTCLKPPPSQLLSNCYKLLTSWSWQMLPTYLAIISSQIIIFHPPTRAFPFLSYLLGAQVVWGRELIWPDYMCIFWNSKFRASPFKAQRSTLEASKSSP